ncbi:acetamidase [Aulographum hederae CBS 113979]|uniref:amidase n=1 Tax=Aulographum hederae CBS 113979 TaxID=1176131 RepID=A0A6G1GLN5_9PEZI|nr:acetamidase [Aulographum hederae CBS 113979]
MAQNASWQDIAASKRAALAESIPPEWRIPKDIFPPEDQLDVTTFPEGSAWFTKRELDITSRTAPDLLVSLRLGMMSSVEVTKAFCKRASAAHQLTNCLSETLFPRALERAAALDAHLRKHGKTMGPLHGLPVSLKDNFNIIGLDSTVGFVSWVNDPATYNSTLVDMLQAAGAVLYCKTNVPTAMMIAETVNNTFGRTVNPLNRSTTSGGSSGGESALIAFGGSCLGVGTDIGGSLRIPAACTGIFTLRPSFGRFTTQRAKSGLGGQEAVNSVNGPMGRALEDIALFSKVIVDAEPWKQDPKMLPIPWRRVEQRQTLKLAVMYDDGMVTPTPPVQRALRETVEKLKKAGHEIIEWDNKLHERGLTILGQFFLADGGKSVKAILDPVEEPFRSEMEAYSKCTELGVHDMWQLHLERTNWVKEYLDQWNSVGDLDGILCPTTPFATTPNGNFKHVGYTGVFNILDYSCVSFPTGLNVDKAVDRYPEDDWKPPPIDASEVAQIAGSVRAEYDADVVHGMPISLQLVAQRLEEEKVLMMTSVVLEALKA